MARARAASSSSRAKSSRSVPSEAKSRPWATRFPSTEYEARLERARIEGGEEIPVLGRDEGDPLALPLDHEPRRDRLHPAGRKPGHDLLPEHRRHLVAVEPVEDPPRLLGVDEILVDVARSFERSRDRVARDLVEDHAANRDLRLQHLDQVPRDGLALAVLVRREQELVGVLQVLLQLGDDLLLAGIDDVVGLEALVDVHAQRAEALALLFRDVRGTVRQVADVADARLDGEVAAQVALDRPRLGGAFHYDQAFSHGATP